jgi:aminoglycoside 6'-N-acetyltransferase
MLRIALDPFQHERDVPLLSRCLSRPQVARWWGEPAQVLSDPVRARDSAALILAAELPVGFLCQQWPSSSELEAAGFADLPSGLMDADLLIGEPDALGRGIGPAALGLLFEILSREGVAQAGLATSLENTRATTAFAKVGMRPHRDFVEPSEHYWYFVKTLQRPA